MSIVENAREFRKSPIKSFTIEKLFGDRDVRIEFESPVTILIADNGSGKTTILSIIYAVLSQQLHRLKKFIFESVSYEAADGTTVTITADQLQAGGENRMSRRIRQMLRRGVSEDELFKLSHSLSRMSLGEFYSDPLVHDIARRGGISVEYLHTLMGNEFFGAESKQLSLFDPGRLREQIAESFPYKNLYFPTYRRIEEELETLGYSGKRDVQGEGLIQFGMGDVRQRIFNITQKIEKSSLEWYSRISGTMLSQLVDGIVVDENAKKSIQDRSALKIVLDRVGGNISSTHKLRIMQLVESGDISGHQYETLAYFLSNLIKVYDQQRQYDASIKDFARVCNRYLNDKQIVYDESKVDVHIEYKETERPVKLADLSSGEKQIVSLFSRLYLEEAVDVAVLFDEPELSLSIEWQKMLLPDIFDSGRCPFLLATTHSPFVFENELDIRAFDLSRFVRKIVQ